MKKIWIICLAVVLVLVVFLIFKDKTLSYLPWLILLACPLLHIFMMKGMHKPDGKKDNETDKNNQDHKDCH